MCGVVAFDEGSSCRRVAARGARATTMVGCIKRRFSQILHSQKKFLQVMKYAAVPGGVVRPPPYTAQSGGRRRTHSTPGWTSSCRGPSVSCPSASVRSTSTASIRISGSSSRSSWRAARSLLAGGQERVLDPFAGSGTTLVQSLESGRSAVGCDIAAFNCLLIAGQDRALQRVHAREGTSRARLRRRDGRRGVQVNSRATGSRAWYRAAGARRALATETRARELEPPTSDVASVVLARAARSARLTTHFDLDFPRAPQLEPYWCHKHKRECRPVDRAEQFLRPLRPRHV